MEDLEYLENNALNIEASVDPEGSLNDRRESIQNFLKEAKALSAISPKSLQESLWVRMKAFRLSFRWGIAVREGVESLPGWKSYKKEFDSLMNPFFLNNPNFK